MAETPHRARTSTPSNCKSASYGKYPFRLLTTTSMAAPRSDRACPRRPQSRDLAIEAHGGLFIDGRLFLPQVERRLAFLSTWGTRLYGSRNLLRAGTLHSLSRSRILVMALLTSRNLALQPRYNQPCYVLLQSWD
jgi:hypothetical protein